MGLSGNYRPDARPVLRDYIVTTRGTGMPISLDLVKEQLRIDDNSQDSYLTLLLNTAISIAELITKRDITRKTYKAFLDMFFANNGYEIRKSPLVSLDAIRYFRNNSLVTIDSTTYYTTQSNTFSRAYPRDNWPVDADDRAQAIEFEFQAGYATDMVPIDLQLAILQHVTSLYENRGDCSNRGQCMDLLPKTSLGIYNLYKIVDIRVSL